MSLTGSEGGKGRGSALLMWSVQTIQSVCERGEREAGQRPSGSHLEKSVGMMHAPAGR